MSEFEPPANSGVIQNLERRIQNSQDRIDDLMKALYGHPELGQQGFRQEVLSELNHLREETTQNRQMCEDLRQERRDELAERRGLKKAVNISGVTNFIQLLVLLGLGYGLWQGIFGG